MNKYHTIDAVDVINGPCATIKPNYVRFAKKIRRWGKPLAKNGNKHLIKHFDILKDLSASKMSNDITQDQVYSKSHLVHRPPEKKCSLRYNLPHPRIEDPRRFN